MTTARRTSRSRRSSGRRRSYEWVRWLSEDLGLIGGGGSQTAIRLLSADVRNPGSTIVRICGMYNAFPQAVPAIVGEYSWSWGLIMIPEEQFVAGAYFDPQNDSAQWLDLGLETLRVDNSVSAPAVFRYEIDVKVKRKLTAQSELMLIFNSLGNPATLALNTIGRTLLQKA